MPLPLLCWSNFSPFSPLSLWCSHSGLRAVLLTCWAHSHLLFPLSGAFLPQVSSWIGLSPPADLCSNGTFSGLPWLPYLELQRYITLSTFPRTPFLLCLLHSNFTCNIPDNLLICFIFCLSCWNISTMRDMVSCLLFHCCVVNIKNSVWHILSAQ